MDLTSLFQHMAQFKSNSTCLICVAISDRQISEKKDEKRMELTHDRRETTSVLYGSWKGNRDFHALVPKGRSQLECKTVESGPRVIPTYLATDFLFLIPPISSSGPSSSAKPKPQLCPGPELYPQLLPLQSLSYPTAALLLHVKPTQSPFNPLTPFVALLCCKSPSPCSSPRCTLPPKLKSPGRAAASISHVYHLLALKLQHSPPDHPARAFCTWHSLTSHKGIPS